MIAQFKRLMSMVKVDSASLGIGGLFRLMLGALLGLAPDTIAAILRVARPAPGFYLQVPALPAAIAGRLPADPVLLFATANDPGLHGLNFPAAADIGFGATHAASWWSIRS